MIGGLEDWGIGGFEGVILDLFANSMALQSLNHINLQNFSCRLAIFTNRKNNPYDFNIEYWIPIKASKVSAFRKNPGGWMGQIMIKYQFLQPRFSNQ